MAWTRTQDGHIIPPYTAGNGGAAGIGFNVNSTITPEQSPYTVYAQWGHRVSFMPNGAIWTGATLTGTGITQFGPRYALTGTSVNDTNYHSWTTQLWPNDPTRPGHFFMGWWTTPVSGGFEYDGTTPINGTRVLYARWQSLQINFNPNGGTPPGIQTRWTQEDGTVANIPVVTKPGFNFMGWTRTQDGVTVPPFTNDTNTTTGIVFATNSTIPTEQSPATVYAQWGHMVRFYNQSVFTNVSFNVLGGQSAYQTNLLWWTSTPWPANPSRVGYTFLGWYTMSGSAYLQRFTNDTIINSHVNLHARWVSTTSMFVNFNANGGAPSATIQTQPNGAIGAGNMPANPTRGGFWFMAWTRTQVGTSTTTGITDGEHFTETSTITGSQSTFTVFAQWGHRIHFNGNGANLNIGDNPNNPAHFISRTVSAGRSFNQSNAMVWSEDQVWPNIPTHPSGNQGFLGWYTRVAGDYDQRIDADTLITGDITVYARWAFRIVYFNPNSGTLLPGNESRVTLANGTVGPSIPGDIEADRIDHWFMGWTRTPSVNDPSPQFLGTTFVSFEESPLTVYAQWGFRVIFICPFGSMASTDRTVAAHQSVAQSHALAWTTHQPWPAAPTRVGHTFQGWIAVGTGASFDEDTPITANNVTLFATWDINPSFTVTFMYGDGFLAPLCPFTALPHSATRQARYNHSIEASSWHAVPDAERLNQGIAWPLSAPDVRRNTPDGRAMTAESWWTQPGGEQGVGEFWTLHGFPNVPQGNQVNAPPGGRSTQIVTEDMNVYPNWTFRVTFHPNGGQANTNLIPNNNPVPGTTFWNPTTEVARHIRDIPAIGPGYVGGTINEHGFVRATGGANAGVPVPAGMPAWDLMFRSGYFFVGWWSHPVPPHVLLGQEVASGYGHVYQFMGNEIINENRTVYARWVARPAYQYIEPPLIPVTFRVNGGNWWLPSINDDDMVLWLRQGSTFHTSALVSMPQFPIKNGHIFMGWYDSDGGPPNPANPDQDRFHSNVPVNAARTLYAHWMPYHIVTFNTNGGTFRGPNQRLVADGRTIHQMNLIWNTSWNQNINMGLGTGTSGTLMPPQHLVPYGHPAAAYSFNFYGWTTWWGDEIQHRTSRANHDWANWTASWNEEPDATGAVFTNNIVITEDRTVYAQWQVQLTFYINTMGAINASTTTRSVALNFSANTHHFHPHTGTSPIFFPNTNVGDANRFWNPLLLYALDRPATLLGWNTAADGSGHWISESTIITTLLNGENFITGHTRLYAQWGNLITFLPNGAPPSSGIPTTGILREAGPGLTLGTAADPFDASIFGLPDQHHVPGDTSNPLWNPYWGAAEGISFGGWNLMPDRTGPGAGFVTPAYQPLTIFAIWLVDIIYDPTGGYMQADGPPQNTRHYGATPIGSPFGAARQPRDMEREGWTFVHWNESRWGLFNGDPEFSPTALIERSHTIYAQWAADVTFHLQGGYIDFNPANVVRTVPEGPSTTTVNWPLSPSNMPANPMRPGYTFMRWYTRELVSNEYVRTTFTGSTDISARGHTAVYAEWEPVVLDMFEFIKTNNRIYENPYVVVPVNGAVFRLYRETGPPGPTQWTFVTSRTSANTADGDGWVRFENVITQSGRYRLIESYAPRGYTRPTGYWIIEWNRPDPWVDTTWYVVLPPLAQANNPLFLWINNEAVDDYVLHVGNTTVYIDFEFIKTDHYFRPLVNYLIQPLPGAVFRFYLYTPRSNSGLHSNAVTAAGIAAHYWTLVYTATSSNPGGEVKAPLWQGGDIFHMIEVAPPGFDDPPGQWRINLAVDASDNVYIVLPIDARGGNPEFRSVNDVLHVYNLPESRPFEFIKVDDVFIMDPGNPTFDPVYHPLDGAVFRLYREQSLNPGEWEFIGTYTSGNSGTPGLVRFSLWMIGRYRLVEYSAPEGFVLQMGHWILDWDRSANPNDPDTWVLITTHHGSNQAFATRPVPDEDGDPQDTRVLGNERKPSFLFHKTDYRMYEELNTGTGDWNIINTFLLEGAAFVLVRYNNLISGTSPTNTLVGTSMIGNAEGEWTVVWDGTSTNVLATPMDLLLDTRFRYFQLIETMAPATFQLPMGQWRIELQANTATNPNPAQWFALHAPLRTHWVRVTNIGGVPMPTFIRNPNGVWYIGNWRQVELPLMGGSGRTMFLVSGAIFVMLGLGLMVFFSVRKNAGVLLFKPVFDARKRYTRRH